ncbi:MAG: hypothetical protein IPK59_09975 [Rhodospirillaceae bacterium]|nr:hypothetical protein [Rhodospirillaceae bacterium]
MHPCSTLLTAIDRYLARFDAAHAGIAKCRQGVARLSAKAVATGATATGATATGARPARYLAEAVALARQQGGDALMDALMACPAEWQIYDSYPAADIGPSFPKRHAFVCLGAMLDPAWSLDFDLGFLLIQPHTLYRDHHHAASELYVPLTGPSRWRFGADTPWSSVDAHQPIWNEPNAVHATLVGETPLLCLYAWTENVLAPAFVDRAKDWVTIEAGFDKADA